MGSTSRRQGRSSNWGGWRPGAGRKPKGGRAGVSHAKRPKVEARQPLSVTLRLQAGLPSLREGPAHEVVANALALASDARRFRVLHHGVRPDQLVLVVRTTSQRALSRGMTALTVRLARGLNRRWKRAGSVFADRYEARALRSSKEVRAALANGAGAASRRAARS